MMRAVPVSRSPLRTSLIVSLLLTSAVIPFISFEYDYYPLYLYIYSSTPSIGPSNVNFITLGAIYYRLFLCAFGHQPAYVQDGDAKM